MTKKRYIYLVLIAVVLLAVALWQDWFNWSAVFRTERTGLPIDMPHWDCPHLLASYQDEVESEEAARARLQTWINDHYRPGEIGKTEIARVIEKDGAFYLSLSTPLPQQEEQTGYRFYKVSQRELFGLYCSK